MNMLKIRKNFIFDKEIIEKTNLILKEQKKSFTEVINLYFQAIIKEPTILDAVEKSANRRTGSFVGMLDGKIGNQNYKEMRNEHHENLS